MALITEGIHGPEFLVSEAAGYRSRDAVDIGAAAAADFEAGSIIVASGGSNTIADSADAGNTGDGVLTVSDAGDGLISDGRYVLACTVAATDAGTFEVTDPEGAILGELTVGAASTDLGGLSLAIADGAADFVVGDKLYVDVSDVVGDHVMGINSTITNAVGLIYANITTDPNDDIEVTAIMRDAEIDLGKVQWPASTTQAQKDAAVAALAAKGIIARS